jgi:hypothetical protein
VPHFGDQHAKHLRSLQVVTAVAVISDPQFGANETYRVLYAIFITTSILTSVPVLGYRLYNAWALQQAIQTRDVASRSPSTGSPPVAPRGFRRGSVEGRNEGFDFGTRVLLDRYNWELSQIHRALLASQLTVLTLIAEEVPMCDPAATCLHVMVHITVHPRNIR